MSDFEKGAEAMAEAVLAAFAGPSGQSERARDIVRNVSLPKEPAASDQSMETLKRFVRAALASNVSGHLYDCRAWVLRVGRTGEVELHPSLCDCAEAMEAARDLAAFEVGDEYWSKGIEMGFRAARAGVAISGTAPSPDGEFTWIDPAPAASAMREGLGLLDEARGVIGDYAPGFTVLLDQIDAFLAKGGG